MSKLSYIIWAVVCGFVGSILRIIAYQNASESHTPEWVYDLDSTAYAIETFWPFLLSVGLSKYLPHLKPLQLIRIPAAVYSYVGIFDACKEIAGLNFSNDWTQIFVFCGGLILTAIFQLYVYQYNTSE